MIKNNKGKFIISSLFISLPILAAVIINAFVTPLVNGALYGFIAISAMTLIIHVSCMILTDKLGNVKNQSKKIINLTFWIVPTITNYVSAVMMAIILGADFSISLVIAPLLGLMFIVLGNYMPKARQNNTFGIKIKWTLTNEENWNATHRFAGKLWVALGVLMLLLTFLPEMAFIILFVVATLVAVIASIVYSYAYSRRQIADGSVDKETFSYNKSDKKGVLISLVITVVIIIGITVLMFSGKLNFAFDQDSLNVSSSIGGGIDIKYSDIESIEYRETQVDGIRIMGYASAKLLYGNFQNDEFGNYIRYTYTSSESNIILSVSGDIIVIAADTAESTREIYDRLQKEIELRYKND